MTSAAASGSTQMGELPRIDCPKCHVQVIKCRTKNNDVYYKYPNHFKSNSTCPYYWFEEPYLEYLRANHPQLLKMVSAEEEKSVAQTVAEEVKGDMRLEMCQLKLQLSEMKAQLGEVLVKIMEAKQEIKEEIAKGNKSPPLFSCHIS